MARSYSSRSTMLVARSAVRFPALGLQAKETYYEEHFAGHSPNQWDDGGGPDVDEKATLH